MKTSVMSKFTLVFIVAYQIQQNFGSPTTTRLPQTSTSNSTSIPSTSASTERSGPTQLTCGCSYPDSSYCSKEGTCDAILVGAQLKQEIRVWRRNMQRLGEFPGETQLQKWRLAACNFVMRYGRKELTDLILLDFHEQEWTPVCASMGLEKTFCSLGPKQNLSSNPIRPYHMMTQNETVAKLEEIHEFLGCHEDEINHPEVTGHVSMCNHEDNCNTAQGKYDHFAMHGVKYADKLDASVPALYIYIIIGAVALLILLILITIIVVYRSTLWGYVYKVNEVAAPTKVTPITTDM